MTDLRVPFRAALAAVSAALSGLMLAACGSSGPPDAWTLAGKLPGCQTAEAGGVPGQYLTRQEVTCTHGEFSNVAIATFRSMGDELTWIIANGDHALKGNLWAAIPGGIAGGSGSDLGTVRHYLGGTVTGS